MGAGHTTAVNHATELDEARDWLEACHTLRRAAVQPVTIKLGWRATYEMARSAYVLCATNHDEQPMRAMATNSGTYGRRTDA